MGKRTPSAPHTRSASPAPAAHTDITAPAPAAAMEGLQIGTADGGPRVWWAAGGATDIPSALARQRGPGRPTLVLCDTADAAEEAAAAVEPTFPVTVLHGEQDAAARCAATREWSPERVVKPPATHSTPHRPPTRARAAGGGGERRH